MKVFKKIVFMLVVLSVSALVVSENMTNRQIVDNYCSVAHERNVEQYKQCKELSLDKLVITLTDLEKEKQNKIVPLEVLEVVR